MKIMMWMCIYAAMAMTFVWATVLLNDLVGTHEHRRRDF